MAVSRNKRKKKNREIEGQRKMLKDRIKLFHTIYDVYMSKTYPVLQRFYKMVLAGHIKISLIRVKALQVAIDMKMKEAIENAKNNLLNKIEDDKGDKEGDNGQIQV